MNSDVFGMFQSLVEGRVVPWDLLVKDVPTEKHQDLDYIIGMLDWDANVNPNFGRDNNVFPHPVCPFAESEADGYREQWVCYGTELVFGEGADRAAGPYGHDQGRSRLRPDRRPGRRYLRRRIASARRR